MSARTVTVCVPAGTPVTTARPVVFSERAVRPPIADLDVGDADALARRPRGRSVLVVVQVADHGGAGRRWTETGCGVGPDGEEPPPQAERASGQGVDGESAGESDHGKRVILHVLRPREDPL